MRNILMLTCQKIGATTGSGVVTTELASRLAYRGSQVRLVYATNEDLDLVPEQLRKTNVSLMPIEFGTSGTAVIPFDIVGMSNEMPYRSFRFSELRGEKLAAYSDAWSLVIAKLINQQRPTLIHVHHLWLLVHLVRTIAPDIPLVVSLHGTELHRAVDAPHIATMALPALRSADRLIALSCEMVGEACTVFGVERSRFVVLGNGFNSEVFFPLQVPRGRVSLLHIRDISLKTRLVTFAGKFAHWKGLHHLISAISLMQRTQSHSIHLAIAGTGPAAELQRYQQLVTELGLCSHVTFLGHLAPDKLAQLFSVTDVFVMPSFREPFGLVLLEALACGCRIVTNNQGGPAEFVPRELLSKGYATLVEGLPSVTPDLFEARQYEEALGRAIEYQLVQCHDFRTRQRIALEVGKLNWDNYVDRLEEVYEDLIGTN